MRHFVVVLAVLSCVVTGCASASDVRAGMDGDEKASSGGGKPASDGSDDQSQDKASKRSGKPKKRNRGRAGRPFQVRLRNVVGRIGSFSSPSGNIGCQLTARSVRCDIEKRRYRPPRKPQNCNRAYGNSFSVARAEPRIGCVGDTALGAPTTLAYGTSTRVGGFGCQSRRDGMRCYNLKTGRGFLVSRDTYEFY